jgi:hypothetical protein
MMTLIERLLGYERITVTERERVLVLTKGRLSAILTPGEHRLNLRNTLREVHDLERHRFISPYGDALWREVPELAKTHLTRVEAGEDEVVLVLHDGRALEVIAPSGRVDYWLDAGPWTVERVALGDTLIVPRGLARRLARIGARAPVATVDVPEGYIGLLSLDGVAKSRLEAGRHTHWNLVGRKLAVQLVETRWRAHEVTGQEILTKDRVTLRRNTV